MNKSQTDRVLKAYDVMADGDYALTFKLMYELAKEGVADAEHCLGWFYEQGIEVSQSDKKAFFWWSKSAPKGIRESENALGGMYQEGRGTKKDLKKAYYWYSLAYKNGDSWSRQNIKDLEKLLSKEKILEIKHQIKQKI